MDLWEGLPQARFLRLMDRALPIAIPASGMAPLQGKPVCLRHANTVSPMDLRGPVDLAWLLIDSPL